MPFDYKALGIQLVEQFGIGKTGIWLFRHKSECMILEMPDQHKDPFIPWEKIRDYIKQESLHLKFITATHKHGDHFNTYPQFHKTFTNAAIILNSFFFRKELYLQQLRH